MKLLLILTFSIFLLVGCSKEHLTDAKLNEIISEKNIDDLTWKDFEKYKYQEDSSNDLVRIYTLDNSSSLILSGKKDADKPDTISVVEENGDSTYLKDVFIE